MFASSSDWLIVLFTSDVIGAKRSRQQKTNRNFEEDYDIF